MLSSEEIGLGSDLFEAVRELSYTRYRTVVLALNEAVDYISNNNTMFYFWKLTSLSNKYAIQYFSQFEIQSSFYYNSTESVSSLIAFKEESSVIFYSGRTPSN